MTSTVRGMNLSNRDYYKFYCCIYKASLSNLQDVLFVGNPIYDEMPSREQARIEVLKRLPQVIKIDGDMVKPTERELATGIPAV